MKITDFQCFSFPEHHKAMKTKGFPTLVIARDYKSNENQCFSNTIPFLELQKAMKTCGFPILFLTRASMKTAPKA